MPIRLAYRGTIANRNWRIGLLFFLVFSGVLAPAIVGWDDAWSQEASRATGMTSLGVLTPFYRSQTVVATITEEGKQYEMQQIPVFLSDRTLDYPYKLKNERGDEVPYASILHFNRTFGDADPLNDLIHYDSSSRHWVTDFSRFTNGLVPLFDAGYAPQDIKISLFPVPRDISSLTCADGAVPQGRKGTNRAPVGRYSDWEDFIAGFARSLSAVSGGRSAGFGFYLGGELNSHNFFCGTINDYVRMYAATYAALKRVSPQPHLMPYPFLGDPTVGGMSTIDVYKSLQAQHLPVAEVGQTANKLPDSSELPSQRANEIADAYDMVYQAAPAFRTARPFIDQFGILEQRFSRGGIEGYDDGPRKASWDFQMLFRLLQREPMSDISHWPLLESVPASGGPILLPTAESWLYQILDNLLGEQMYVLAPDVSPELGDSEFYAIAFVDKHRLSLLVSGYTANLSEQQSQHVDIALPVNLVAAFKGQMRVRFIPMAAEDTPAFVIRRLLQGGQIADAQLAPVFAGNPKLIGRVRDMAGTGTRAVGTAIAQDGPIRTAVMTESKRMFMLSNYSAKALNGDGRGGYRLDAGEFSPGELKLFVIE